MAAEYHQSFHGTCQESGNEISETPKCILGDRCFSRDSELDPEKKPKVAVGPEICPLCKNVSIDKLEERTKQDMSGACRAFFAARTLRKNCEKFADDARERRINGEGHIFVCHQGSRILEGAMEIQRFRSSVIPCMPVGGFSRGNVSTMP